MERTVEPSTLSRLLGETVARMEAVERRLAAAQLTLSPAPEGWSSNDILWHIRATADVYGEHISRILKEDEPSWRHVSPRARMKKARYDQLPFAESLAAFARQRTDLLTALESIPPEAWERIALVRVDQREWRLTLRERVSGMANHEKIHCAQMEEVAMALSGPQ